MTSSHTNKPSTPDNDKGGAILKPPADLQNTDPELPPTDQPPFEPPETKKARI